jgi:hypothetical protein
MGFMGPGRIVTINQLLNDHFAEVEKVLANGSAEDIAKLVLDTYWDQITADKEDWTEFRASVEAFLKADDGREALVALARNIVREQGEIRIVVSRGGYSVDGTVVAVPEGGWCPSDPPIER